MAIPCTEVAEQLGRKPDAMSDHLLLWWVWGYGMGWVGEWDGVEEEEWGGIRGGGGGGGGVKMQVIPFVQAPSLEHFKSFE